MHLWLHALECGVNCSQGGPNRVKRVRSWCELQAGKRLVESNIIVPNHLQHRPPEVVGLQLGLVVETPHELPKIAAVLLQVPLAIHFNKGKELHAGGTQRMVGGNASRIKSAPKELACTSTNRQEVSTTLLDHRKPHFSSEIPVNEGKLNRSVMHRDSPNLELRNSDSCASECE